MWQTAKAFVKFLLSPGTGLVTFAAGTFSNWATNRAKIKVAETDTRVALLQAQAEVAAYKVKADIEWDLKWADQASSSWKDEFLLLLWSFPLIGIFIPYTRPFVMEGFEFLKAFNPDAAYWYMAGWSIIFAATFGVRQAASLMLPGSVAKMAGALGELPDDIPEAVVVKAQASVDAALKKGRELLR